MLKKKSTLHSLVSFHMFGTLKMNKINNCVIVQLLKNENNGELKTYKLNENIKQMKEMQHLFSFFQNNISWSMNSYCSHIGWTS